MGFGSAAVFFLWAHAFAAIGPSLGETDTHFLDRALPNEYWQAVLPGAKTYDEALRATRSPKSLKSARAKLEHLTKNPRWQDLALFELAKLDRKSGNVVAARQKLQEIISSFPNTSVKDAARLELAECDFSAADSVFKNFQKTKGEKKSALGQEAAELYRRGLARLNWPEWDDYEPRIERLIGLLQETKSGISESFYGEALNALSSSSKLRIKLLSDLPKASQERLLRLARYSGIPSAKVGIKAIQPDDELFRTGVDQVLDKNWTEAKATFTTFLDVYPDSSQSDRAAYWLAVADEALGADKNRSGFSRIYRDSPLSFSGVASALRADTSLESRLSAGYVSSHEISGNLLPQQLEFLWRARALSQVGRHDDARREMEALFRFSPGGNKFGQALGPGSLALALVFSESSHFPGAFFHLRAAMKQDPDLLSRDVARQFFPKPFNAEIEKTGAKVGVDPLLIYSIAKQESAFLPEATSQARALGLMQVLLATGREIQSGIDRRGLLEPKRNLEVGAEYFAKLLKEFDGNVALSLAAYNAGPTRVRRWWREWQKKPIFADGFRTDAFVEMIPISETKDYVASIIRNYVWYRFLDGDTLPKNVDNLVVIPGKGTKL